MSTPNLAISHIAAAQNQPEVTANDAFDQFDDAMNAEVSFANADANMTLSQAQLASGAVIKITGALTAQRQVNLPAGVSRSFMAQNATTGGKTLLFQVTGAPGNTVALGASAGIVELFSDGTNVTQLTAGSGSSGPNFADEETPGGSIDGSNAAFTLANAPSPSGSLLLFLNGVLLKQGTDYTLASAAITMTSSPASGDILLAWYRH